MSTHQTQRHESGGTGSRTRNQRTRRRIRRKVFARDDYTCQDCGYQPPDWQLTLAREAGGVTVPHLTLDHVVPLSRGGRFETDNLQTLCADCNIRRGNQGANQKVSA